MLYLAYGSNMSSRQMKDRCPSAKLVSTGYLDGWKLVFDGYSKGRGGMVADLRKSQGSKAAYVLWEISIKKDIQNLDRCEGYYGKQHEKNHYEKEFINLLCEDNKIEVAIYIMTKCKIWSRKNNPIVSEEYKITIEQGLQEHGLVVAYLKEALEEAKHSYACVCDI